MKLLFLCVSLCCASIRAKPAPEVIPEIENENCYEQCEDCISLGLCGLFTASTSLVLDAIAHKAFLTENETSACLVGGFGMLSSVVGKVELQNRNMARADARVRLLEAKKTKIE